MDDQVYVCAGIRWGFTDSGHTELVGEEALFETLSRVAAADEIVFPSLSYAYHADLRLMDGLPPSIAAVVFVNLGLPGAEIPSEIQMVRSHLPCVVFVLYASDQEFKRCMSELPDNWAKDFQHYYLLRKTEDESFLSAARQILDEAKRLAVQRKNKPRFHSAFISYSHDDKRFANWLFDHLKQYGVHCWLDEKQLRAGDRIHTKVDEAIRKRDKILLCASKSALTSWWVDNEINSVISKEQRLWKETKSEQLSLIPLNLDGYLFSDEWNNGWKNQIVSRLAPDFTDWRARLEIEKTEGDQRQEAIAKFGWGVFENTDVALFSVRRALYSESNEEGGT